MNLDLGTIKLPDEWALNISKSMAADCTWRKMFFDSEKYVKANIELQFTKSNIPAYYQGSREFEAGLSIIDVMMFNTVDQIQLMLDDYEIIK